MKKLGIMQPYFLPYIGYFQLIDAVDEFVIYDNIQYTKKGWINRNRILQNGTDTYITLPLKKASDFLDVRERFLADNFDRNKLFRQIQTAYRKAPYYEQTIDLVRQIIFCETENLFEYIYHSVLLVCKYLNIETPILVSSTLNYDNMLKGQDKVQAICMERNAEMYVNAIGGIKLYQASSFLQKGIELRFIQTEFQEYRQFGNNFLPGLSILDVMMFNSTNVVDGMLKMYRLLEGEG